MSKNRRPYVGPSEAQSAALAMRDAPYTEANRTSYVWTMQRTDPPADLRTVVYQLRKAYADEVPTRIHVHETDAGGDPAWSPEFTRYLTGSDMAVDRKDDGTTEVYTTPFRAALSGMSGIMRPRIVERVVVAGLGPGDAAKAEGVPDEVAMIVADSILRTFWRRLSAVRLDMRPERVA